MDPNLILNNALERQEISAIEAIFLLQEDKSLLPEIFHVANEINTRLNENVVSYIHSMLINYTNVCRSACKICTFYRDRGAKDSYTLQIDDVLERIAQYQGLNEVCLQGGLNQDLTLPYFTEMLKAIKHEFPGITIQAFAPAEIWYMAKRNRTSISDVLGKLRDAGLDSIPGSSADVLNDKIRKKVTPDKLRTGEWIDVIRHAHALGIKTSASILFGGIENEIYLSEHMEIVRNLHRETGGFTEFILTPLIPEGSEIEGSRRPSYMKDWDSIFRVLAVSRIFFSHSIKNLQATWVRYGMDHALRSLNVGINDLGGTVFADDTIKSADVGRHAGITPVELEKSIQRLGKTPRRRDTFYNEAQPTKRRSKKAGGRVAAGSRG